MPLKVQVELRDDGMLRVATSAPDVPMLVLHSLLLDAAKAVADGLAQQSKPAPGLVVPHLVVPSNLGGD